MKKRRNIDEGRGMDLKILGGQNKTTYEFSTSNQCGERLWKH